MPTNSAAHDLMPKGRMAPLGRPLRRQRRRHGAAFRSYHRRRNVQRLRMKTLYTLRFNVGCSCT